MPKTSRARRKPTVVYPALSPGARQLLSNVIEALLTPPPQNRNRT